MEGAMKRDLALKAIECKSLKKAMITNHDLLKVRLKLSDKDGTYPFKEFTPADVYKALNITDRQRKVLLGLVQSDRYACADRYLNRLLDQGVTIYATNSSS
jgi:hypothetical protein